MLFREAAISDIKEIQLVRCSVKENCLSDPSLVTDADYVAYLTKRGKGWVCEVDGIVVGFAIADLQEHNIWALFVHPDHERQGIGRRLHDAMLNWYFAQTHETVWLSTNPNTRAAKFYQRTGWKPCGIYCRGELKFELTYNTWIGIKM